MEVPVRIKNFNELGHPDKLFRTWPNIFSGMFEYMNKIYYIDPDRIQHTAVGPCSYVYIEGFNWRTEWLEFLTGKDGFKI